MLHLDDLEPLASMDFDLDNKRTYWLPTRSAQYISEIFTTIGAPHELYHNRKNIPNNDELNRIWNKLVDANCIETDIDKHLEFKHFKKIEVYCDWNDIIALLKTKMDKNSEFYQTYDKENLMHVCLD